MRILVLGADGYLGWPTSMYLSARGHVVAGMDNFAKRRWEMELNVEPLIPIRTLHDRVSAWTEVSGEQIELFVGDLRNYGVVEGILSKFRPDAIVHYGEQPSAPYSMIDHNRATFTQVNNVTGTLNVLWAMKNVVPECRLIKLGTMGEYGTPNIDIEEGFIRVEHNGRQDLLPFPCQPNSFYHLSKVHDSHNMRFACKIWNLAATDLHQGVVYGLETDETKLDSRLETSFHYDEVFGTALNRFCVQAVAGIPISVYGKGGQKRGFLNIRDTLRCVELAILNPAKLGEYRVFNQFTETFTITELAELVVGQAKRLGISAAIGTVENPRLELEEHYYNPTHEKLLALGLEPHLLSDVLIDSTLERIQAFQNRVKREIVLPRIKWDSQAQEIEELKMMWAGA